MYLRKREQREAVMVRCSSQAELEWHMQFLLSGLENPQKSMWALEKHLRQKKGLYYEN